LSPTQTARRPGTGLSYRTPPRAFAPADRRRGTFPPARSMYVYVVLKSERPARIISATGLVPAAAAVVIAECDPPWPGRT